MLKAYTTNKHLIVVVKRFMLFSTLINIIRLLNILLLIFLIIKTHQIFSLLTNINLENLTTKLNNFILNENNIINIFKNLTKFINRL